MSGDHFTLINIDNKELKVERAKFEMKGEKYDPKLKPRKLRKKELEALKKKHDKMFAWVPDKLRGQRSKREKASCCLLYFVLLVKYCPLSHCDYSKGFDNRT